MTRRITPQSVPKLRKSTRDREKEEEERWWNDEKESFPEFWYVVSTFFLVAQSHYGLPSEVLLFPSSRIVT